MIKTIAVIGATGMLGKPVAHALAGAGFRTSVLARNPAAAEKQLNGTIEIIKGDIQRQDDLRRLMKGQDALYLNLSIRPTERPSDFHTEQQGLEGILRIAKEEGIRRIGYISSLVMRYQGMNNFHWWAFDIKKEAVRKIKESGIPFTIFYPSNFMDNFEGNYRRGNRLLLAGESQHKMYFIAAEDFAAQVVRAFQRDESANRDYVVQGPEPFTADEAAAEYARHYTKQKLSLAKAPLGLLRFFGRFSQSMHYGSHIIEALNNFPETFEAEDTWRELGKPETTLRQFAAAKSQAH